MRRIKYYITLLAVVCSLYSCKEEDDQAMVGTGANLTGVWTLLSDEGPLTDENGLSYGMRITEDGKIQKVKFSGTSVIPLSDHAEGIITSHSGNSFHVTGIDGEGIGKYTMDTVLRVIDNKYTACIQMQFYAGVPDAVPSDSEYPISNIYIKESSANPTMQSLPIERDNNLFGEWVEQFGSGTYAIDATGMVKNGAQVLDWCTYKDQLYILHTVLGATFEVVLYYNVSADKLITNSSSTGRQEFVRKGMEVKGDAGVLGGIWLKTDKDHYINWINNSTAYGLNIKSDGNVHKAIAVSNGSSSTVSSYTSPTFIMTSAKNGKFTALTPNGEISGTYKKDSIIVFQNNKAQLIEDLEIISDYTFYLDENKTSALSFNGHYLRVTFVDGTEFNPNNCYDANLIGIWSRIYVDSEYDDNVKESFEFKKDGTQVYSLLLLSSGGYGESVDYWATMKKDGKYYLYNKLKSTGKISVYEYLVSGSDFYFKDNAGNWFTYSK